MSNDIDIQAKTRGAGQTVFVFAALAAVVLLLLSITRQTVWVEDAKNLPAQPRFWPAVALIIMCAAFAQHAWRMRRRKPNAQDWAEARRWVEPLEYVLWFMVYVFAVPIIGFLPMSLLLACALTWRLGYQSRGYLLAAAVFAVATVILFKGLLGVKIPGAAIYEVLPGGLRSFFILYL
ncbi:MAG: tripartite tricarboxylate transporter TctB family protein [Sulfitobacter sp.]|nr:tripartite tricarboxylate transporter TctB family protein [Sulfitobacter sp.]